MYIKTKLTFTFNNKPAAKIAKDIARESFLSLGQDFCYRNAAKDAAEVLTVDKRVIIIPEDQLFFTAAEMIEIIPVISEAIAKHFPQNSFRVDFGTVDDYSESWGLGLYENGTLEIISQYYPEGDCEFLTCPECGEQVVRFDLYDPRITYTCPDCGEKIDLSQEYENCKPICSNKKIKIY